MKLIDKVIINAGADKVWQIIDDPDMTDLWNPKFKAYDAVSEGERRLGFEFRTAYEMNGNMFAMEGEISGYEPGSYLEMTLKNPVGDKPIPKNMIAMEKYWIEPCSKGVMLRQEIEVINSGIPKFIEWIVEFIQRFGTPMGPKYIIKLKELAEE
ncbi:MAG: SRPBCC family protein [Planctomycetota bacterium]|jgi:uncharacterized protein YndB with AHSA1/START domain